MSSPNIATTADLKIQVVSKLLDNLFLVGKYLSNSTVPETAHLAYDVLWYVIFPDLPPDVRFDKRIQVHEDAMLSKQREIDGVYGTRVNRMMDRQKQRQLYHYWRPGLRQIHQDIMTLLYEKYLRAGYRGLDIGRALDSEREEGASNGDSLDQAQ